MMYGGKMKKYAVGSEVPGIGMVDKVPALLTPGEFVVNKQATQSNLPLLQAINGGQLSTQHPYSDRAGADDTPALLSGDGNNRIYARGIAL